jgi:hypothetical protein
MELMVEVSKETRCGRIPKFVGQTGEASAKCIEPEVKFACDPQWNRVDITGSGIDGNDGMLTCGS